MPHNPKIIAMFAVSITTYISNAGSQLAFTVQAFFMPGHIVYHIWYPCTPVWSVNAPTAFEICDRQRERHGYFHFKNLLLCLTMQKFLQLISTASERPPTKRVSISLRSTLTTISTPWVSTCKTSPSAFLASVVKTVLPSLVCSTSVAFTIRSVLKIMSTCWPIYWNVTGENMPIIRGAENRNVNGICFRSSIVIQMPWYYRLIFPDFNFLNQSSISLPVATPSGVIAFLHSDLRTNFALHINRYTLVPYHSIPRTPWNKKKSKRERVLKRKYFKSSVQQSNSPTRKNISKRNSLLYSSIYFLFKSYIYTTEVLFCWTVLDMLDLRFSTIQQGKSNKKCKKCGLLDMLDGIQRYFIVIKFV